MDAMVITETIDLHVVICARNTNYTFGDGAQPGVGSVVVSAKVEVVVVWDKVKVR